MPKDKKKKKKKNVKPPSPSLGSGLAERARKRLITRDQEINKRLKEAGAI